MPKQNNPDLWLKNFPRRSGDKHKYDFGHALIFGSRSMTGATRLATEACARIGAGLTTIVADDDVASIYRATLPAHLIVEDNTGDMQKHLQDERRNAVLIGPGAGPDFPSLRQLIKAVCKQADKKIVLDADALNAMAEKHDYSFLHANCVLTPHEGEFKKLFPDIEGEKIKRAQEAAELTKAVIVLKGSETVIAVAGYGPVINYAPPWLATAGTGDVLAGMITGLLAQGMESFEASCAATWIHGECARVFGPGLVASDLEGLIPAVVGGLGF